MALANNTTLSTKLAEMVKKRNSRKSSRYGAPRPPCEGRGKRLLGKRVVTPDTFKLEDPSKETLLSGSKETLLSGYSNIQGARESQEDVCYESDDKKLQILNDGHGGSIDVARFAADMYSDKVKDVLDLLDENGQLNMVTASQLFRTVGLEVDGAVKAVWSDKQGKPGSTILMTYIAESGIYVYSLGDCRAAVYNSQGDIVECNTEKCDLAMDEQLAYNLGMRCANTTIHCFNGRINKPGFGRVVVTEESMSTCFSDNDDKDGSCLKEFMQMNYTALKNKNDYLALLREKLTTKPSLPALAIMDAITELDGIEREFGLGPKDIIRGDMMTAKFPINMTGDPKRVWRMPSGIQPTRSLESDPSTGVTILGELTYWDIPKSKREDCTIAMWCDGIEDCGTSNVERFGKLLTADGYMNSDMWCRDNILLKNLDLSNNSATLRPKGDIYRFPADGILETHINWLNSMSKEVLFDNKKARVCRLKLPDNIWKDAVTLSTSAIAEIHKELGGLCRGGIRPIFRDRTDEGLRDIAEMIGHYCVSRGSSDNCSIILVRCINW